MRPRLWTPARSFPYSRFGSANKALRRPCMPNLIDLSIPVRHGDGRLGLEVAFSTPYSYETCGWQGSSFSMFAHYATHVDAPNHFIRGAKGIDQAPIAQLMGAAALVALDDHGAARAITAD